MPKTFAIAPLDASFGAVVSGLKVAALDDAAWRELYAAWLEYALLIFPGQHLSAGEQIAFASRFGQLEHNLLPISNVKADGSVRVEADNSDVLKLLKGNFEWHADSTYMPVLSKGAVLSSRLTSSSGGQTGWADMRAAYDALDEAMRMRVEGMTAHHSLHYSQSRLGHKAADGPSDYNGYGFHDGPEPLRPLVKVHPETGRKSLLIGRHAHNIPGLDGAESERFLDDLVDFACSPPRTYHHDWVVGDAVIWDNRCLLHRVIPWDMTEPRTMWQSRIAGDPVNDSAL
jgi:alpha-ketoglutarate-dependent taurine dioxygenase